MPSWAAPFPHRHYPPRGALAQLAEQRTFNPRVPGSIPGRPTGLDRTVGAGSPRRTPVRVAELGLSNARWAGAGGAERRGWPALGIVGLLFPHDHCCGFAFEVDVRLAADVDGNPFDDAVGEPPGWGTGVVVSDAGAGVPPDGESLAGEGEPAGLGLDPGFADLVVAVAERQLPPPRRLTAAATAPCSLVGVGQRVTPDSPNEDEEGWPAWSYRPSGQAGECWRSSRMGLIYSALDQPALDGEPVEVTGGSAGGGDDR